MSMFKVSICVVTYNQENYIEKCIQSILAQETNFSFEIIISDDASTDRTPEIISSLHQQYPTIIRPFLHKQNISAGVNFQFAHNQATGEYVAHCDGDDYFLPGKLQYQADFLDKHREYVQVWHRQKLVDADDNVVGNFPHRYVKFFLGRRLTMKRLAVSYGLVGQHSSQMYRRSARTIYENHPATIDYFYALDIGSKGFSTQLDKFLGCYRIGNASTLTTTEYGKVFVEKALVDTALFYTEKYGLGKRFYGNLWVRRMVTVYSKAKPSAEFDAGFAQFDKYKNLRYRLSALNVYLFIHSSFNLFRIIGGYIRMIFSSKQRK